MFDIFGNMESAAEINEVAASLREEGERDNLLILFEENGLDTDLVDLYLMEELEQACDETEAAIGKLTVELEALKKDQYGDIIKAPTVEYLKGKCIDEGFARLVRRRNKRLQDCIDECISIVKKELGGKNGGVSDAVVFLAAVNYYKS